LREHRYRNPLQTAMAVPRNSHFGTDWLVPILPEDLFKLCYAEIRLIFSAPPRRQSNLRFAQVGITRRVFDKLKLSPIFPLDFASEAFVTR